MIRTDVTDAFAQNYSALYAAYFIYSLVAFFSTLLISFLIEPLDPGLFALDSEDDLSF